MGTNCANVSAEKILSPNSGRAGRAIRTVPVETSSDDSGWQTSSEMLGPERSEITMTPIDGRLAIAMTSAITAASCRIEQRSIVIEVAIRQRSAFAAGPSNVGDDIVGAHVECAILANLMAVGAEQERLD